jgi:O-antigen/teichoic acid export membrane protein
MTRGAVILRNVVSNWAGFVVNVGVTLVLTPFVLRHLGAGRYGVWILTSSIIGYYGMLDIGFRAGVTQYLTRYLAVNDYNKASECMSSAVAVMGTLGAVMLGLSLAAATLAPRLLAMPPGLQREAFWCILIVGISSAIQFGLQPFTSVFTATQRFDLANGIGVVTRLLTAAGITAALVGGLGLVGVSLATCTASAVDYVIRWCVARRLVPQVEVSLGHASWARIREVGSFGAWNFLSSINAFTYQHVPNLLIASRMPVAAVGHYALATGLTRQMNAVLSPVPAVLYPAAAELHVRADREGLERLYHDGSRLMLLILLSAAIPAAFFAADFYRLWIGSKYLTGVPFQSVAVLFQILLISVFTDYSSGIAGQVLVGAGRVRAMAVTLILGSVLNVTSSVVLIRYFGLAGVAMGTVIGSVVVDLIAVPVLAQRLVGLPVTGFLRRSCPRPLAVAALDVALISAVRLAGPAASWGQLIVQGALVAAGCIATILLVGVTSDERCRFVSQPLQRLFDGFAGRRGAAVMATAGGKR